MDDGGGRRAAQVRADLVALWGDDLPPTNDPVLSILCDAVAVDDQFGIAGGLVVQGDRLSVTALTAVLTAPDVETRLAALPPGLRGRVSRALQDGRTAPD